VLGTAQAIRIPKAFEFKDVEFVYITQDDTTGNLVISKEPVSPLDALFSAIDALDCRDRLRTQGDTP